MLRVWPTTTDVQEHLQPAHIVVVTKMEGTLMPYSAQHKQETRNRILRSARRLFNRRGFAEVTIDEIMAEAGLTRGGFYKHFTSKDDLYSEAIVQFRCKDPPEEWQRKHVDPCAKGAKLARMIMDAYLSHEHFEDRDGSCPTLGVPSDVSRSSATVKRAFRKVLDMMLSVFVANLRGPDARERALALVSVCVGAMVMARAIDDPTLANSFRRAARKHVLASSGWGTQ
jgi:TetR/AcrR family transcriptional regulator, transcriptional repressor for nem operon